MSDFFPPLNNPGIFSTNEWISAWQQSWGDYEKITALTPCTHTASDRYGFYCYLQALIPGITFRTAFPSGISTSIAPSLRSEYFSLNTMGAIAYLQEAMAFDWDQLFIADLLANSSLYKELVEAASALGLTVRVRDTATTYAVALNNNSFANYVKNLGSNTRLKLFNKRKKLYQAGDIQRVNLWPRLDEFIAILNGFHQVRWGKPCYQMRNLQQIKLFLTAIAAAGGEPDLSVIYCNGEPISAVLDLKYRQRIYNIQSGYLEQFHSGISLGTLHFGFQLEQAFASDALYYDFMAGIGKHANYKASLATHSEIFSSVMLVRSPLLKVLYGLHKKIQNIRNR